MPRSLHSPGLRIGAPPSPAEKEGLHTESVVPRVLDELEFLVADLVASWQDPRRLLQPRRWHRARYECTVALTPLDEANFTPLERSFLCRGRNVSPGGLSFMHEEPLPHRVVAVTFVSRDGRGLATLATRLNWCRFTRNGTYQSGGKFLKPLPLLEDTVEDWSTLQSA